MIEIVIGCVVGYLLGSVPTAVWYGKWIHGVDIRQLGSGNAGATNSLRNFGKKAGIVVLLIDSLKGAAAVLLATYLLNLSLGGIILVGLSAIIGHLFPVFANFRGGKGVATALGVAIAIYPLGALICVGIFLITVLLTRYVSLGSLLGTAAFAISAFILLPATPQMGLFGIVLFALLAYTHRQNLQRLLNGTESKIGQPK